VGDAPGVRRPTSAANGWKTGRVNQPTALHNVNPPGPGAHPGVPPHFVNPGFSGSGRWEPTDAVPARRTSFRADLVTGAFVVAALAVLGAALGLLWQAWSPPGPLGLVVTPGAIQPDETEAFAAGDGRFAIIGIVVGLLAGALLWLRHSTRGPVAVLALAIGGLLGAGATALVGHLVRGGSTAGKAGTLLQHVPLTVHAHGLFVVEAAVAVLVYVVCAAFAERDDLGRAEP
jgi:hypothetical protein